MSLVSEALVDPVEPESPLEAAIARGLGALKRVQRPDGHFIYDLEADAAIPAEYVLVKHFLGEPDAEMEQRTAAYLRRIQEPHGGWPMLRKGEMNISASVKAYFALKVAGDPVDAPHMVKAREVILKAGGAVNVNVFTKITLALWGIVPWRAVPVMPVEIMHLPGWSPFHIYKISYWARCTLVTLLPLMALKPRAANPRKVTLDELFVVPPHEVTVWPKTANQTGVWGTAFHLLDKVLRAVEPYFPAKSRASAIDKALAFVTERLNGTDGIGAIYPSMANTVMLFHVLGRPKDDPEVAMARTALDGLVTKFGDEGFCQPCKSPVWDTALAAHAMMETEPDEMEPVDAALGWLKPRQILDVKGDWAYNRPDLSPGGWAFEYNNHYYPDLDDTAAVVMAMDRARAKTGTREYDHAITRARDWVAGMQCTNGGWGAYDVDNDAAYLNKIPFADHGALLDPPTPDVTARCLSMLAQLGERPSDSEPVRKALDYLYREQHPEGSWFGRWGINYVYGTWCVLSAFNAVGLDPNNPATRRAVAFLERVQNPDGGWGEGDQSYDLDYERLQPSPSTASQTAWALIGLMAVGRAETPAVARGIEYLTETQDGDGVWNEDRFTGTGFPRVFYLRYSGYPAYFPLWALARYRNLTSGNMASVLHGM